MSTHLVHDLLDVLLVTDERSDTAVLNGVDHSVHAERRVDRGHDYGLGEAALGGDHPLWAGVLKYGKGAGGGELLEVRGGGCGDETLGDEGGAELRGEK